MKNTQEILDTIKEQIMSLFTIETSGHDFWHMQRVYNLSMAMAKEEGASPLICGVAAWLHEFDDSKLTDITGGAEKAVAIMQEAKLDTETINAVMEIIKTVSFKGASINTPMKTLEGKVVQDADRLDAMGAIGIARTFTYGGSKGRLIYHPNIKPMCYTSPAAYHTNTGPSINHFYEKLLILKDRINTSSGKKLAEERHAFMQSFLSEFYKEWNMGQ